MRAQATVVALKSRGWPPPGEKHWHGAVPTTAMTHIAIQEPLDDKAGFLFLAKTPPLL